MFNLACQNSLPRTNKLHDWLLRYCFQHSYVARETACRERGLHRFPYSMHLRIAPISDFGALEVKLTPLGDLCCGLGCDVIAASAHQWLIPQAPTHVGLVESSPPMSSSTSEPRDARFLAKWLEASSDIPIPTRRQKSWATRSQTVLATGSTFFSFLMVHLYPSLSCKTFVHRGHLLAPGSGVYMEGDSFQLITERRHRCHCLCHPHPFDAVFTLQSGSSSRYCASRVGQATTSEFRSTRLDPTR